MIGVLGQPVVPRLKQLRHGDEAPAGAAELVEDGGNGVGGGVVARTVVHERDVAGVRGVDDVIGQDARTDRAGVGRADGPEYDRVAASLRQPRQIGLRQAVGRPKQHWPLPGDASEHRLGSVQLAARLRLGRARRVRVAVTADGMAPGEDAAHQVRVRLRLRAELKEGGVRVVRRERGQHARRHVGAGPVIERERQQLLREEAHAVSHDGAPIARRNRSAEVRPARPETERGRQKRRHRRATSLHGTPLKREASSVNSGRPLYRASRFTLHTSRLILHKS